MCICTSRLAARCPARVARCPRPRHDRPCLIYSGLLSFLTHTMASQPTGKRVPAFARPSPGKIKPTMLPKKRVPRAYHGQRGGTNAICGGWRRRAHGGTGNGRRGACGDSAPAVDQRDEAEGGGKDFVRGGQEKTPTKKNVIVTCEPW